MSRYPLVSQQQLFSHGHSVSQLCRGKRLDLDSSRPVFGNRDRDYLIASRRLHRQRTDYLDVKILTFRYEPD